MVSVNETTLLSIIEVAMKKKQRCVCGGVPFEVGIYRIVGGLVSGAAKCKSDEHRGRQNVWTFTDRLPEELKEYEY